MEDVSNLTRESVSTYALLLVLTLAGIASLVGLPRTMQYSGLFPALVNAVAGILLLLFAAWFARVSLR